MILQTERLVLRPLEVSDEAAAVRLLMNEQVAQTYMLPEFSSREEAAGLFHRLQTLSQGEERLVLGICLEGSLIGIVNDTGVEDGVIELGWALHPDYHSCGCATEAVSALLPRLLESYRQVVAGSFEENTASIRVMEKCGMERLSKTEQIEYRGVTHCCVYYGKSCSYQDMNAATIDRWVEEGWEWGMPISHEIYENARQGQWDVLLTPVKVVPHRWFGQLKGKKVLGLASGGGQQMPVFAALGADCTVLDYSVRQLESEAQVATREGYSIRIVRADMTKPLPFEDGEFDLVFHPVSNCYIKEVKPVFRECFRVLKPGGVLLCGLGNEVNYLVDGEENKIIHAMPFDPLVNEQHRMLLEEEDCGMQFSHTVEEQIGGQLEAGFVLTDLYGDTNGEGRLHEMNVETYLATRAVKP